MSVSRVTRIASSAVAAIALSLGTISLAQAQSEYPASRDFRAGHGTYGQFDLSPGETQTLVDIDESTVYRVCIVGKKSLVIVDDSKRTNLDHGDCWDVQGKKIIVKSDDSVGETQGTYHRFPTNPRRHRNMQ